MKLSKFQTNSALSVLFVMLGCALVLQNAWSAEEKKAAAKKGDGEWRQLFNGKDMKDWTVKITGHDVGVNHGNLFRVEDGILKTSYDEIPEFKGQFGHLFYKEEFSNYILRIEYRFTGEQCKGGPGWAFRNSGVMIHGQSPESMGKNQKFPVSIEVQTLGGSGKGDRTTGNLCSPGTNVVYKNGLFKPHCTNSSSKTYHGDVWVTMDIEVHGNGTIKHIIDGKTVLEYEKPQLDPRDKDAKKLIKNDDVMLKGGTISLQAESHPVEYRKVEIKVLDE